MWEVDKQDVRLTSDSQDIGNILQDMMVVGDVRLIPMSLFYHLKTNIMETIIVCYEHEIDKTSEMTISDAVKKLSGYWKEDTIEPMLTSGQILFTPYAEYQIKKS